MDVVVMMMMMLEVSFVFRVGVSKIWRKGDGEGEGEDESDEDGEGSSPVARKMFEPATTRGGSATSSSFEGWEREGEDPVDDEGENVEEVVGDGSRSSRR